MPTHTHRIDSELHSAFLAEEREDPVTGDPIQVGDEVVLCASCGSAFLKDSWDYLDGKHCEQKQTLAQIPLNDALTIRWTTGQELFKNKIKRNVRSWWSSLAVVVIFLLINLADGFDSGFMAFYLSFLMLWAGYESQVTLYHLSIKSQAIKLRYPFRIGRPKNEEIRLRNLSRITFQDRFAFGEWRPPLLILEYKNGEVRRLTLPRDLKKAPARKDLFDALHRVSRTVEVKVITTDARELRHLRQIPVGTHHQFEVIRW